MDKKTVYICSGLVTMALVTAYGVNHLSDRVVSLQKEVLQLRQDNLDKIKENTALEQKLKAIRAERVNPGVYTPHLRSIIRETLSYLGEKSITNWERLILLTIVTESDKGRYTKQVRGPAKGVAQCEPATEKEVLAWLKKHRPGTYERVKQLRVPAHLRIHEAEYNTSYSIAVCYGVYLMRSVQPKGDRVALAKLYKQHYNTYKGKATVPGVLAKLEDLGVNI